MAIQKLSKKKLAELKVKCQPKTTLEKIYECLWELVKYVKRK